jgi:hypothetical protein
MLVTHVPAGTETDNAQTESKQIADAVGNATTAGPLGGNKVDKKGPVVTVACPSSALVKGSAATAAWSATDSGSGIAGAAAGVISLDTSTVGSHAVAAPGGTARDQVGNESAASDPCSYAVVHARRGFFSPVDNKDAAGNYVLNRAKSGSTIPVKFSLGGNQGLSILPAGYPMSSQISCSQSSTDVIEDYSTATVSGLSTTPTPSSASTTGRRRPRGPGRAVSSSSSWATAPTTARTSTSSDRAFRRPPGVHEDERRIGRMAD